MPNVSTGGKGSPEPPESGEQKPGNGRLLARRYRLHTAVGHGGMGTVWHAHDEVLGRDVAVKEVILPYGLSEDEREIHHKRTFREARTAARLAHPSVVTVFDVVEEDGRPWIIMELIRAPSLDQVIKEEGRLPPRRAAQIARQMLGALHTAHEAGVLHRDVKPSNVLVAPGDRVVLTDFGIATAAGDATLTQTGLVMGSPAYIAPERARGRTAGPACDLWSLGITLYAMVEGGNSPYERSEPMASLIAVISDEPEPPQHAGPLRPVIEGLLRKEPDERMTALDAAPLLDQIVRESAATRQQTVPFESVDETEEVAAEAPPEKSAETRDDLPDQAEEEMPTAVGQRPPPPTEPVRRSARIRTALAIAAIAVVALLILSIWAWLSRGDQQRGANGATRQSQSGSASANPSPTQPTSTASGVPQGFRRHTDPTGFSIAVPKDWSGPERRSTSVFYYAPDRRTYVQVDQTDNPNPSALADWERSDRSAPGQFSNYKRLKLGPTGNQPPVPDTGDGSKSADWEFTWGSGSDKKHILNRGFVTKGHGYAILIAAPDSGWSSTIERLRPVYASFKSAD